MGDAVAGMEKAGMTVTRLTPEQHQAFMDATKEIAPQFEADLGVDVRDAPCNTHIYFDLIGGALNMTVCCRSNDMLWGAYGANAVHFSILQELIAHALNVEMGVYRQFSNNFHLYTDLPVVQHFLENPPTSLVGEDPYDGDIHWLPLVGPGESWTHVLEDARTCVYTLSPEFRGYRTAFFNSVVEPLYVLYHARLMGSKSARATGQLANIDWGYAFNKWCDRRDAR